MAQCGWVDAYSERCRHDAEDGETLCIFHLPARSPSKPAGKFWHAFANYYMAQLEHDVTLQNSALGLWAFHQGNEELVRKYKDRCLRNSRFDYRGFVFPAMDAEHSLRGFVFSSADFTQAQFAPGPDRAEARAAERFPVRPRLAGGEPDISEQPEVPEAPYEVVEVPEADLSDTHFHGNSTFRDAQFLGTTSFGSTEFATLSFLKARFAGDVDFTGTKFGGDTDFRVDGFEAVCTFTRALFKDRVDFRGVQFDGLTSFDEAEFLSKVEFGEAHFNADTNFTRVRSDGPADFSRVTVAMQVRFLKCTLHDCLLLESPDIAGSAAILLWGLRFAHGRSRIEIEQNRTEGSLVESSGEILLRDVAKGMDRVSFLRTDVYSDRIHVRFSNVEWNKGRKSEKFLLDAKFLSPIAEWISIGLGARDAELAELFNQNAGSIELETAVQEDTERIVRDIRRSYEEHIGYSDAGDYHVIEMDFRRRRRKTSRFYKVGLWLYWVFSDYGESPSRALRWLLGTWGTAAVIYMFTGFCFPVQPVRYLPALDLANFWTFIGDFFLRAAPFAFVNLFASYFRNMAQASSEPHVTFGATVLISVIETTFGIVSLTLFLLAVRRRFRR